MKNKFDDSLFDDSTKYTAPKNAPVQYDDSLFEDTPSDVSQTESGLRGSAQGLSFNLADEITGGSEALLKALFGGDKLADLPKNARKYIDESRTNYEAAEKANPGTYLSGEIGGSIAPAFLTGGASAVANLGKVGVQQGLKGLVIAGAKQGAASAFGASKADLLTGDMGDVGQAVIDTGIGTGIGAAAGLVVPMVGKQLGKAVGAVGDTITDSNLAQKFINAKDLMSRTGKSSVGKKGKTLLEDDTIDIAKSLRGFYDNEGEVANKKITQSLENLKDSDFSKEAKEYLDKLTNNTLRNEDQSKIERVFDNFMSTKTTEIIEKGEEKAINEVKLMMLKGKSALKGNPNASVEYSPIENIDGKFLQTTESKKIANATIGQTPTTMEGTAMAEAQEGMKKKMALAQAKANQTNEAIIIGEPVFDKESNSLITSIASQDGTELKPIVQSVGKDKIINTPILGDQISSNPLQVNIPEDKVIKTITKELNPMNASQFTDLRKNMNELAFGNELEKVGSNKVKAQTADMKKFLLSKMSEEDQLLNMEGNATHIKNRQAASALKKLDPNNEGITTDIELGKILNTKDPYAHRKFNEILDQTAENIDPQIRSNIADIPMRRELSDVFTDKLGFSGKLSDLVSPNSYAVRGGEFIGKNVTNSSIVKKVIEPVANFTKRIVKMDDNALLKIANFAKSSNNAGLAKFANAIEKATQDSTKRDRLLWALSQQPAFREMMNNQQNQQEEQN